MTEETVEWYGVRCLFDHGPSEMIAGATMYEERVVIVRGTSFEDAIAKAEADAERYARVLPDVSYLGFAQAYEIADELADAAVQESAEVFSLMRSSPLPPKKYIRRFFSTGTEHEGSVADDPP